MVLDSAEKAKNFLIENNLLSKLEDEVLVEVEPGRNFNFKVTSKSGCWFLKSYLCSKQDFSQTILIEQQLQKKAPNITSSITLINEELKIIVYELIQGINGITAILNPESKIKSIKSVISEMAMSLSLFHAELSNFRPTLTLRSDLPWAFTLGKPDISLLSGITLAGLKVLQIIQADNSLLNTLNHAAESWKTTDIIHGDIKLANYLCTQDKTYLIDWEFSQLGDVLWDWAGLMSSLISTWVLSMNPDSRTLISKTNSALFSYTQCQDLAQVILISMKKSMYHYQEDTFRRFVSIRLIQTAFECCEDVSIIPSASVLLLQVSSNISSSSDSSFTLLR
ncbi:phosphotransferase family protein [Acinetobacter proteolyticus]|uniref:phosphotransferase family protein n=1 Tax=Acinetobacter proteolyticus TaxID=1776741 RepID=UPI003D97857B